MASLLWFQLLQQGRQEALWYQGYDQSICERTLSCQFFISQTPSPVSTLTLSSATSRYPARQKTACGNSSNPSSSGSQANAKYSVVIGAGIRLGILLLMTLALLYFEHRRRIGAESRLAAVPPGTAEIGRRTEIQDVAHEPPEVWPKLLAGKAIQELPVGARCVSR
ncbi:hypothetical protein K469DRAFT_311858 [Zopfia rhizophila CBS 207.26]|uniref:Uncharacterized protein n=1 Tax=Zopfia rhizophila CBS 207.26 TaxID=1314779 RepID=A0A6A6EN24_9PEZI|nr:hypothetical protein K469DRAFT_311858 [Zopfia rhizophila CBS 207.26]